VSSPASSPESAPGWLPASSEGSAFPIETDDFRFVLPAEPFVDEQTSSFGSQELPMTRWTIDSPGWMLRITAMNVPDALDENSAQIAFDAQTAAMQRRGHTVVADSEFTRDGAWRRTSDFELDGNHLFVDSFAKGKWVVSITGFSMGSDTPPGYDEVVASFGFL
jgi:hypothetical protein